MPKASSYPLGTPGASDTIMYTDVVNTATENVTIANLAASAAFADQYEPLGGPQFPGVATVTSRGMFIGAAAPTESLLYTRVPVWNMRDAVPDRLNCFIPDLPPNATIDIDVVWASTNSAISGTFVVVRLYIGHASLNETLSTVTQIGLEQLSVPASTSLYRSTIARDVDLTRATQPFVLLDRLGANTDPVDNYTDEWALAKFIFTVVPPYDTIANDGAWCWFNDARLLGDEAENLLYAGYVTADGSIGVSSLDLSTDATVAFTLNETLEQDDHDTPSMALLGDGNLFACYSTHSIVDDPIYFRVTTTPGDVSTFDTEQTITLPSGDQPCYPKPVVRSSDGRIYIIFRNLLDQDYIYSDDDGATWSAPATLFNWTTGWRGYVNMAVNGDRVDFICNDDNPNTSVNCNLYHCYLDLTTETLYTSAGASIGAMSAGTTTAAMTKIYDYTTDGDAWGWDVVLDANSRPQCVFATFPGGSSAAITDTNHQYKHGRWDGSAWVVTDICDGGRYITENGTEYRYSGGLGLLPDGSVYLSREVGSTWEVEKWERSGSTWSRSERITSNSWFKNVRPTTPEGWFDGCPTVAWMAGWYENYSAHQYSTRLCHSSL